MTLNSNEMQLISRKRRSKSDLGDYGYARVRDEAFLAVLKLWMKRKNEGVKITELADKLGRDKAWVSRHLKGPANWTLRTFGEMVEALDGEAEIKVFGLEEPVEAPSNFNSYVIYDSIGNASSATHEYAKVSSPVSKTSVAIIQIEKALESAL
jgi:hypothetical protein